METIISKLYDQQDLSQQESQQLFDTIIKGELDPILMSAALTALKIKGETPEEIAGQPKPCSPMLIRSHALITTLPILSEPEATAPIPLIFLQPPRLLQQPAV